MGSGTADLGMRRYNIATGDSQIKPTCPWDTKEHENRRDKTSLAFFASLTASDGSEAKNVPPIGDRWGFLIHPKGFWDEIR